MTPHRRTAVILAICLVLQGCASVTPSKGAKLTAAVEISLGSLQDVLRMACNAPVASQVPYTPIAECTPAAASWGLTTAKFRTLEDGIAFGFDFIHDTLAPALRLWNSGQPPPKEFADFARIVSQIVDIARTVSSNPAYQATLTAVQALSDALGSLGTKIGSYK